MEKKKNKPPISLKDPFTLSFFGVLVLVACLVMIKSNSFKKQAIPAFFENGTDQIIKVEISYQDKKTVLEKKEGNWLTVSEDNQKTDEARISNLLEKLAVFKKGELVSENEKNYPNYGVDENSAINLIIYQDGGIALDVLVGKVGPDFETNYFRLKNEKEVYLTPITLRSLLSPPKWSVQNSQEISPTMPAF